MAYARGTFGKPNQDTEQYYSEMSGQRYNQSQYYLPRPVKDMDKQVILGKLAAISQQLYEVIFLKQSVNSLVNEQRVKMVDFMRDLKRHLFQLGLKSQRDSLSKRGLSESSVMEVQISTRELVPEYAELQRTCEQLRKENEILKEKYQSMLIHYREEVEQLSSALARSLQQAGDKQGINIRSQLTQAQQKLRQEQGRFAERVKYLQSEFMGLQQEYLKEREGYQRQLQQYRQRQRQLTFQESQIQRKNILLVEREKVITERQIMLKQERGTLERRENKISDYEHNQLRREKQKADTQKYALKSQYYVSYDRLPEPQQHRHYDVRSERQRSGGRLSNSRVDINARLRQIQQQKRGQGNFKNSRMSEAGGIRSQRSSSKSKTPLIYGVARQSVGTGLSVNVKLESMLESLQRDLSDMK